MPSVTVSVDIRAPLASVWEAAADLANHGQWMADVESIGFDSEARQGPGTVMRVATKVGPFRTTDVMQVTSWETGRGGPIGAAFARPILTLIWRGNLRRLKALLET